MGLFSPEPTAGAGASGAFVGLSGSPARLGTTLHRSLSPYAFHDSAAALLIDGEVVFALEEERLNRHQHANCFPERALQAAVRHYEDLGGSRDELRFGYYFEQDTVDPGSVLLSAEGGLSTSAFGSTHLRTELSSAIGTSADEVHIQFYRHHDCHAAMAIHFAGVSDALVLVVDGNGEDESISVYNLKDGQIDLMRDYPVLSSVGHIYRLATHFLGLGAFGEYKLMGLAAYSNAVDDDLLEELLTLTAGEIKFADPWDAVRILNRYGYSPRSSGSDFGDLEARLAATVQRATELVLRKLIEDGLDETGHDCVVLVGGVALNGLANGRLASDLADRLSQLFVPFAPNDCGAAVGAALLAAGMFRGEWTARSVRPATVEQPPSRPLPAALGPSVGRASRSALSAWGAVVRSEIPSDLPADAAEEIANGSIVGWVRGRSEFGPRALGNRSILADVRDVRLRERVNLRTKGREGFRPLAPAVRAEDAELIFEFPDCGLCLDYMGIVLPVTEPWRPHMPAVVHVDGTARPQIVWRGRDEDYWRLISEVGERTTVPAILNTSFNLAGEPMVLSADDALRAFVVGEIDVLYLAEFRCYREASGLQAIEMMLASDLVPKLVRGTWLSREPLEDCSVAFVHLAGQSLAIEDDTAAFLLSNRSTPSAADLLHLTERRLVSWKAGQNA